VKIRADFKDGFTPFAKRPPLNWHGAGRLAVAWGGYGKPKDER